MLKKLGFVHLYKETTGHLVIYTGGGGEFTPLCSLCLRVSKDRNTEAQRTQGDGRKCEQGRFMVSEIFS